MAEVCEFVRDGTHASPERTQSGIPVLSAEHVRDGRLVFRTGRYTSQRELAAFRKRLYPKPGDVLLTIVGTIGRVALLSEERDFVFQRSVCVFRPRLDILDPTYLRYCLESVDVQRQLARETRQATQAGVYLESLNALQIPVPDLGSQRRISEQLEQADRLRRLRQSALQLGDSFLGDLFFELFGDPYLNPRDWPHCLLGEQVAAFEGGVNFNPTADGEPASEWRILKISSVSTGQFLPEESKPIAASQTFSDKLVVKTGDLIMSRANTVELVGAVARVRTFPPKVLLPDKLWRLRLRDDAKLLPDYILWCLRSPGVRREIEAIASGTSGSMKNISKEDAGGLRIPVPQLELQKKFASIVDHHERLRNVGAEALRQSEHLLDSLLFDLFGAGHQKLRNKSGSVADCR